MEKLFIKARGGEKISVVIEKNKKARGLVFMMHGLAANKESEYLKSFAKAFYGKGFTVVRFDNRHSIGESEGEYKDVNFTNTYQDLEDVIDWASRQNWYIEPFILVGHSLGGACILWYADNNLHKVSGLVSLSTAVSSEQTLARFTADDFLAHGDFDFEQFKNDILKYKLSSDLSKFKMPFLMIVGDQDIYTPLEDQKIIYDKVSDPKEIHTIKGLGHVYREPEHIKEAVRIIKSWIDNNF